MRVELRVRNTDLADAMQRYVEQRLGFELGRFRDQIGRVRVKISGLNGSRGGTKNSCRISADVQARRESRRSGSRPGSACRDRPCRRTGRALAGSAAREDPGDEI